MLIDDEPFVLQMLSRVLVAGGCEVVTAASGLEGVERAREIRPAVVLTDLTMPTMDGYAVCRYLKNDSELRRAYVIMLTARGREIDRKAAIDAGADEYITTPFTVKEAVAHVQEIAEKAASAAI